MLMMCLDPVPPYLEKLLSKLEVKPEEKRVSSPYYGYYGCMQTLMLAKLLLTPMT